MGDGESRAISKKLRDLASQGGVEKIGGGGPLETLCVKIED